MSEIFYCCVNQPLIKVNENGYVCPKCGKYYAKYSILFQNETLNFEELRKKNLIKLRGRKVSKTSNNKEIATLQTGKVSFYNLSEKGTPLFFREYEVKKSSLELHVQENNIFLTITDSGVVDVYEKNNGTLIGSRKIKSKFSNYYVTPCEREAKWLLVTAPGIYLCDESFSKEQEIVNLFEELDCYKFNVKKINSYNESGEYVFYIRYLSNIKDNYHKYALIVVNADGGRVEYSIKKLENYEYRYTYQLDKNKYYALKSNVLYEICNDVPKKICELPIVVELLDGDVLQHPEQFLESPIGIQFINKDLIALLYDTELIIFDISTQKIKQSFCFKENLMQSFLILDNRIIFSTGLNTYIYNLE